MELRLVLGWRKRCKGTAYCQNMGQFDHMAQQPSGCPRLDSGVNYSHFDPQGGPSNLQQGPIAFRHPGILTTWRHGCHLDNMAPWRQRIVHFTQSKHLKRKTLLLKIHWSRGSNLTEVTDNIIIGFHPPAMNHKGPIIKTEPNMSNKPTPTTPHVRFTWTLSSTPTNKS
ncbi:hypothetical protein PCANC_09485 [Puccinia coronata f. sp. avenae]|nr:hypothetical protein PCANC_09485 [Puccinia coronata f. sp. avenae]